MHLRLLQLKDVAELYALIVVSRPDLKNLIWSQSATFETTATYVGQVSSMRRFGIFLDDNSLAGCISLEPDTDPVSGENFLWLGYWMGTPYRGKGHMKAAVNRLLNDSVHKYFPQRVIRARIRDVNKASQAVVQRAGFMEIGQDFDGDFYWTTFQIER